MKITHLPAADRIAVPWRNGGGVTREVAAFPANSDMVDFLWRVSVAEVAAAGPFSLFPGIDRILTVLEGRLRLNVAGEPVSLSADSNPLRFRGEASVDGWLESGTAVTDLNVMVRRGAFQADVRRMAGRMRLTDTSAIVFAESPTTIEGVMLGRHDALLMENGQDRTIDVGETPIISVALSPDVK